VVHGIALVCLPEVEAVVRAAALTMPHRVLSVPSAVAATVLRLSHEETFALCAALHGCE
jgi:hypothetical protein